ECRADRLPGSTVARRESWLKSWPKKVGTVGQPWPFGRVPSGRDGSSSHKEGAMIRGVHTMFYSSEPEALRALLRDNLGLPAVDVGEGWLIFDLPEADMGCHPSEAGQGPPSGTHYISFYCDDIERTVTELKARGVEFTEEISNRGYGLVTHF